MAVKVVVGAQYGDEGKGRIVDSIASEADMVVRFQGGDNAGHTVVNEFGKFALHMIPSGIFNPRIVNVIGTGCVVNPLALKSEMETLSSAGIDTGNLLISSRAQMVMPYHLEMDRLEEVNREANQKIGTTKRGIGPAYEDKTSRSGLRMGDLLDGIWLEERLANLQSRISQKLLGLGGTEPDMTDLFDACQVARGFLSDRIVDTVPLMRNALTQRQTILLEGQLGIMRDLDYGIYPFVTSSHPLAPYAAVGAGIPLQAITDVIGVTKSYTTSVGAGPFPTELNDEVGETLRQVGGEFGATTGRPRRCGWLDLVTLRYAAFLNGLTEFAMTKLDVLDEFETIKVCNGYRMPDGNIELASMPDTLLLERVEPMYVELPGWKESTVDCRTWQELPRAARGFVKFVEEQTKIGIPFIGVGPRRDQFVLNPSSTASACDGLFWHDQLITRM